MIKQSAVFWFTGSNPTVPTSVIDLDEIAFATGDGAAAIKLMLKGTATPVNMTLGSSELRDGLLIAIRDRINTR